MVILLVALLDRQIRSSSVFSITTAGQWYILGYFISTPPINRDNYRFGFYRCRTKTYGYLGFYFNHCFYNVFYQFLQCFLHPLLSLHLYIPCSLSISMCLIYNVFYNVFTMFFTSPAHSKSMKFCSSQKQINIDS